MIHSYVLNINEAYGEWSFQTYLLWFNSMIHINFQVIDEIYLSPLAQCSAPLPSSFPQTTRQRIFKHCKIGKYSNRRNDFLFLHPKLTRYNQKFPEAKIVIEWTEIIRMTWGCTSYFSLMANKKRHLTLFGSGIDSPNTACFDISLSTGPGHTITIEILC